MFHAAVRHSHSYSCGNNIPSFVRVYAHLPLLPTNRRITISNLGIYNYNVVTRIRNDDITMGMLNSVNSKAFPLDKGTIGEGFVSPAVIVDERLSSYRTLPQIWPILTAIHDAILIRQGLSLRKVLPITVTTNECWLDQLAELVNFDIVQQLLRQRDLIIF